MTQAAKFTLWTDPNNKELLERVRGIQHPDFLPDWVKVTYTCFRCDFCGIYQDVSGGEVYVACDPDRYIFEDELIRCWKCVLPDGARILCTFDSEKLFHIAKSRERVEYNLCIYNPNHDYYLLCSRAKYFDGCTQRITEREDPYYQIDKSLFQILYDLLEKLHSS